MHYYQFNIGDYRRDTPHLSRLEHSIYRDLIDGYYLDEKPIPLETQSVTRRLRLVSDEEATALKNVLSDFFVKKEDGWHHSRIESDIANYYATCEKNKENGKKGGRPKGSKALQGKEENPVGYESDTTGNPNESQINPNQEPITKNQLSIPDGIDRAKTIEPPVDNIVSPTAQPKPKPPAKGSRLSAEWVLPKAWGDWALGERTDLSADDVRREADNFRDHWISTAGAKGVKADWLATWRKWIRSDYVKPSGKGGAVKSNHWFMSSTGIEAKGAELGIKQESGEVFPNYRNRIYRAAGVTDEMVRKAKIDAGERV